MSRPVPVPGSLLEANRFSFLADKIKNCESKMKLCGVSDSLGNLSFMVMTAGCPSSMKTSFCRGSRECGDR